MKSTLFILPLQLMLGLVPAFAATSQESATALPSPDATTKTTANTADKPPAKVQRLQGVSVSAALDQARNALSPETGSSQYTITQKAIAALPLGTSTPVNQVLLQAPGVVQDAYGALHVRGDHGNLQYRINGVIIPESISGFGQTLDARTIANVKLLDGALPAQYGLRTAGVVQITTRTGHALGNGGSIGVTGGSFGHVNPHASIWGNHGRWSWFATANYLEDHVGIENPTASRKPIHDETHQAKAFGDLTYLVNDHTRLSFMAGLANSHFEIPNNPGQSPAFTYLDQTRFDSALLDEHQNERTRFGVLSLQGEWGATDYQVALGQRFSSLDFFPDHVGDLMFDGIASRIGQSNRASTLQADFMTPLGENHALRYGIYGSFEQAPQSTDSWVFPADAAGEQTSPLPINIADYHRFVAHTWSAYLQDEWSIGDNLTVNYGVRGDVYHAFRTERQLSPRLGLVYQAGEDTTLHAGYARYFTPPATEAITTTDIGKFAGTTNAQPDNGNNTPLAQRGDYYDAGVQQQFGNGLTLGLDAYYKRIRRLQDEGQFGAALIYSTFNYAKGRSRGVELTANYDHGPITAYFNAALAKATGQDVITSQYNFSPEDLAYIATHAIFLDHDQRLTASGGISYRLPDGNTRVGADYLFGSGLRRDGAVPNGASMPAYFQLNFNVAHDFTLAATGKLHVQLALVNALDRSYELRDGTGVGVGAPQFGPRRGVYLSVDKDF